MDKEKEKAKECWGADCSRHKNKRRKQKKDKSVSFLLHVQYMVITISLSGTHGVVDGVRVVLVESRLQEADRECPSQGCQAGASRLPLPLWKHTHHS